MDPVEWPGIRVRFRTWTCKVMVGRYHQTANFRLDLVDAQDGTPVAVATVNAAGCALDDQLIMVKDWSENEGMPKALMAGGLIDSGNLQAGMGTPYPTYHLRVPPPVPDKATFLATVRSAPREKEEESL